VSTEDDLRAVLPDADALRTLRHFATSAHLAQDMVNRLGAGPEGVRDQVTYFTFGVRYAREDHPSGEPGIHPDGWWEVVGCNRETARRVVHAIVGREWAFDYSAASFDPSFHPRGCLRRISTDAEGTLA
jgi:hypothetical protein